MANLPSEEMNDLINEIEFEQIAENTIMNREELVQELIKVRREGYSISRGERVSGAFSLCAPIKNRLNEVIAGVTITIPNYRLDEKKLALYIEYTKKTASEISNEFM